MSAPEAEIAALKQEVAFMHDCNTRQKERIARLEGAIEQVLADEESQDGGWGPDVTMVAVLKEALRDA